MPWWIHSPWAWLLKLNTECALTCSAYTNRTSDSPVHSSYKNSALCQRGAEAECECNALAEDLESKRPQVWLVQHLMCPSAPTYIQTVLEQDTEPIPTHLLQIIVLWIRATAAAHLLKRMTLHLISGWDQESGLMVRDTIHFLEAQQLCVLKHDSEPLCAQLKLDS